MRRLLPLALGLAVLSVAVPPARAGGLAVIPFPGTPDAAPSTQVIFSTLRPSQFRSVVVTGSRSGAHSGRLSRLPAAAGTAFAPDRAFMPGERVSVSANLTSIAAGAAAGDPGATTLRFRFRVARPVSAAAADAGLDGPLDPKTSPGGPTFSFRSAPGLRPPRFNVTGNPDRSSGDIFLTPTGNTPQQGPMILNERGQLVWYDPLKGNLAALNLEVQRYQHRPVLTWFRGTAQDGEDVIMNSAYRTVAIVRAGNGYFADAHEFQITPRGTAWLDAYVPVRADLRSVGGASDGAVVDGVIQEVDIRTGKVLWEWHSLGHIPLTASYTNPDVLAPWDAFHLNSIQQLPDGNLLISSCDTWTVYEISHRTGRVIWSLGGKRSSFTMGPGTNFEWQHDPRLRAHGLLTLFDDGSGGDTPPIEQQSSAKALQINVKTMHVKLVHRYTHSPSVLASAQGNVQTLPQDRLFVGWGDARHFSEYTPGGTQIFDGYFANSAVASYRAFRFPWRGQPRTRPSLDVVPGAGGRVTLYASWNGATQVTAWRILGGTGASSLKQVARMGKSGFETTITLSRSWPYLAVQALSAGEQVLGTSAVQSG